MGNTTALTPPRIHWQQVTALIALDVAIIISWIAYNKYQPALLEQFDFTEFAVPLAILQGAILFATPPIAGLLADRMIQRGGNRLPVVTVGINFVSMVFMVVALTVFADPGGVIRLLFPVMVALWLIAMNIFHSPAISAVEMFVPASRLPQVVALFAVIAGMAEALEPSIVDLIEFFGGPLTFAVGGVLVFTSGWWFARSTRNLQALAEAEGIDDHRASYRVAKSNVGRVLLLGIVFGVFTMFFFEVFPGWAEEKLALVQSGRISGNALTSILIAFGAVTAYPMSFLAERLGSERMAILATAAGGLILLGLWQIAGAASWALFVLFPLTYALSAVSFLPIAFLSLESRHKVFGIGLFFSGVELAPSVWDVFQVI
ncbi:MAG: MFS transporter [Bacteroidota bacterium]